MAENRYTRQTKLPDFGEPGQQKLKNARVLVVGAGGLGVPVLQYLTGMGTGTLGIIDGDIVKLDNLHRQVLYNEENVGKLKVDVAIARLSQLNSAVKFVSYPHFLTVENALHIIGDYDLVIDASDNFGTRYLINDACVITGKPFIYGAVQQYEGYVSVFNYLDGPTYRCLYPNLPQANEIPDCDEAGVLGIAPGIIGCQQALQAVKILTGIGNNLSGHLLVFDMLRDEQYKVKLKANPTNKNIRHLQANYDTPACAVTGHVLVNELFKLYTDAKPFLLLDVREPKEFAIEHLEFARSFPLSTIKENIQNLPKNTPLITICEIGGRSNRAAAIIAEALPGISVRSVEGGMETWFDELGEQLVVYPEKAGAQ